MELTVFERLVLLNVLPREGGLTTLKIVRQLRESLSFTEEEHTALQFRQGGDKLADGSTVPAGRLAWNEAGNVPKDIPVGEKATAIVLATLRELDRAKKLTADHLPLCEKFGLEEV